MLLLALGLFKSLYDLDCLDCTRGLELHRCVELLKGLRARKSLKEEEKTDRRAFWRSFSAATACEEERHKG